MYQEGHITFVVFLPKMHYLNLIMRKHQTNVNLERFCKELTSTLQKYQHHERQTDPETEKGHQWENW